MQRSGRVERPDETLDPSRTSTFVVAPRGCFGPSATPPQGNPWNTGGVPRTPEDHIRQNLRSAWAAGGLANPEAVALLHGTLASYSRHGQRVSRDVFCGWAALEGWSDEELPVLRGIALAADYATPDLGELTTTKAADGSLVVHLTRDEARLARSALREVVLGPYRIPESEFQTLLGFRRDDADGLLNALSDALTEPAGG
jgi:hypothetical protein